MIKKTQLILLLLLVQLGVQAQQRYTLDNKKSKILWKVETIGKHHGYILFSSGRIDYLPNGNPAVGSFVMDMKSMRSSDRPTPKGRGEIDNQLRSPDFFDVAHYPSATMEVTQLLPTSTPLVFRVNGKLTIKGISHPIEFNATINKKGDLVSVKANLKIDRTKWNIDHKPDPKPMDFFGTIKDKIMTDDIQITLDLAFHK
ncbi:YceI family protein [Pedobacter sp. Hv1]|uniref:YceI family protein n=1 Tax=Pedobacter sp. Hv1 TaxID=1740090 RepID=UPI0006D8952F|nr:YceI family protein [Pedobacter sp. Hv1]KQC01804.1 hypothetical protein AQF98_05410 [Pedobacter sp. Hv1]